MHKSLLIIAILIIVVAGGFILLSGKPNTSITSDSTGQKSSSPPDSARKLISGGFSISQDRSKIDIGKIHQGCLGGKDCIPSIDNPKFETAAETDQWLEDNDLVFGINIGGDIRSYPQRILNWHELVNDTVGGQPVLISFCPLCGTAIAFNRTVGQIVEFGVSGKLVNSNLVMYSRVDNSLWQQQGGEQIVGDNLGLKLTKIPLTTTTWGEWKSKHPDTKSLSRNTGFTRDYTVYPYGDYEQSRAISFPVDSRDDRLHEKSVVYGIEVSGEFAAYSEDFLKEKGEFTDSVAGTTVKLMRDDIGNVTITNQQTGEEIVPERGFWFSWVAFHPQTKLNGYK